MNYDDEAMTKLLNNLEAWKAEGTGVKTSITLD